MSELLNLVGLGTVPGRIVRWWWYRPYLTATVTVAVVALDLVGLRLTAVALVVMALGLRVWRWRWPASYGRVIGVRRWRAWRRRWYRTQWDHLMVSCHLGTATKDALRVPSLRRVELGEVADRLTVRPLYGQDSAALSRQPGDVTGQVKVKIPADHVALVLDTVLP